MGASHTLKLHTLKSATRSESIAKRLVSELLVLNRVSPSSSSPAPAPPEPSSSSSSFSTPFGPAVSGEGAGVADREEEDEGTVVETPETSLRLSVLEKMSVLSCTRMRVARSELLTACVAPSQRPRTTEQRERKGRTEPQLAADERLEDGAGKEADDVDVRPLERLALALFSAGLTRLEEVDEPLQEKGRDVAATGRAESVPGYLKGRVRVAQTH